MKFSGICLITHDVASLAVFYAQVLNCAPQGDDTHAEFPFGDAGLAIYSYHGTEAMAPGSTAGAGTGAVTLIFEVQDIHAEWARIQAMGIPLVKPLQTHPWGSTSFWFRDPDGNLVDFVKSK
jgi:predicted enzyme related to lactoylglutathione lyase